MKEITLEELKNLYESNQLLNNSMVIDFIGTEVESQINFVINTLDGADVITVVDLNPNNIFKQIYYIKSNFEFIDTIFVFNPDSINIDRFLQIYGENFSIKNYLKNQKML